LKEVKEEILKIAHSIKHETMDEIATGSSRIIGQDKNALITLGANKQKALKFYGI